MTGISIRRRTRVVYVGTEGRGDASNTNGRSFTYPAAHMIKHDDAPTFSTRGTLSRPKTGAKAPSHLRRATEAESDGAHEGGLPGAVRPHDHVQARSKPNLDVLVDKEVLELEANDRAIFELRGLFGAGS